MKRPAGWNEHHYKRDFKTMKKQHKFGAKPSIQNANMFPHDVS